MEYGGGPSSIYEAGPSGTAAGGGSASNRGGDGGANFSPSPPQFDVLAWYPRYQSCLRYFVEVAQHSYPCQALAAFINIRLPFQKMLPGGPPLPDSPMMPNRVPLHPHASTYSQPGPSNASGTAPNANQYGCVSLHGYIRRLVATGFDVEGILHGWFGDDWKAGIGPLHEIERRNYLFAAKSGGWGRVKKDYDTPHEEAIPYLRPLSSVKTGEIEGAEESWSGWLAMEDWMLGPRAPTGVNDLEGMDD